MKWSVKIILLLAIVAAALAGARVAQMLLRGGTRPPLEYGTVLDPPRPVPEFELRSHLDRPVRREDLAGRYSLVFFGFTQCPDVCPTELALLADVRRRLAHLPESERPRLVFVSVDPQRDTPEIMGRYVQAFDPSMLGITGDPAAIDAFAAALGIVHEKVYPAGAAAGGQYTVDHSAVLLLLDKKVRQIAIFTPPQNAAGLAGDYVRAIGRSQ